MIRRTILAIGGCVWLAACATGREPPPVPTLLACPVIDTTALRRCEMPSPLPAGSGEAVLAIWQALALCVDAARDAIDQIERGDH